MIYHIAKNIALGIFKCLYRMDVKGLENIPKNEAVILASNHIHNFDPISVGIRVKRPINFMAKEELFKYPILSSFMRAIKAFPVKRGGGDRQAMKQALTILKNKEVLGIFPEGTRSKTGELGEGHSGVGLFALKTKAAVIPVAVKGNYKLFSKLTITYGEPVNLTTFYKEKNSTEEVVEATKEIMKNIQILLNKDE